MTDKVRIKNPFVRDNMMIRFNMVKDKIRKYYHDKLFWYHMWQIDRRLDRILYILDDLIRNKGWK